MKIKFSVGGKVIVICEKCRCINNEDRRHVCPKCRREARKKIFRRLAIPVWDILPHRAIGFVLGYLSDAPEAVFYRGGFRCLYHTAWSDDDGYFDSYKRIKIGGIPQERTEIDRELYPHDCSGQTFCNHVDTYLFGFISVGHYSYDV